MKDDGFFNHKPSLALFKYCKCHHHRIYCTGLLKREANSHLLSWIGPDVMCYDMQDNLFFA